MAQLDCLPYTLVDIPAIDEHLGMGLRKRLEVLHHAHGQVHLAPEGSFLLLTDRFLDVHLRVERELVAFNQIQTLKQAVAWHGTPVGAGIMRP